MSVGTRIELDVRGGQDHFPETVGKRMQMLCLAEENTYALHDPLDSILDQIIRSVPFHPLVHVWRDQAVLPVYVAIDSYALRGYAFRPELFVLSSHDGTLGYARGPCVAETTR